MNDLERALRELDVAWPATPDLTTAVMTRIAAEAGPAGAGGEGVRAGGAPTRQRGRRLRLPSPAGWRSRLAYFAATLAIVAGGTLAASPAARSTVLEWLGLKSVEIKREEPRTHIGRELALGTPIALPRGTRVPKALGKPDEVYATPLPDGSTATSLLYAGPPLILVQMFRARATPFIQKTIGAGANAERLTIDGAPAYWITGAHGFAYESASGFGYERQRLADKTLLMERDGLLIRIEGEIAKARAVAIARSLF